MNDDRRIGRQQCPARPDDGGHALACVVGRGGRKSGRPVSPLINPIIYAEVSIRYSRIEDLEAALPKAMLDREALPYEAAFLAEKCFLVYRQRGGTKRSPLPDFFIGAHEAVAGYRLLTRDAARYRSYFPRLPLIAPD
jgi:predicted nucleic acid-binding protein